MLSVLETKGYEIQGFTGSVYKTKKEDQKNSPKDSENEKVIRKVRRIKYKNQGRDDTRLLILFSLSHCWSCEIPKGERERESLEHAILMDGMSGAMDSLHWEGC